MKFVGSGLARSIACATALSFASVSIVAVMAPDVAIAKNGKGADNGKSGSSNGKSGGSKGKSASAKSKSHNAGGGSGKNKSKTAPGQAKKLLQMLGLQQSGSDGSQRKVVRAHQPSKPSKPAKRLRLTSDELVVRASAPVGRPVAGDDDGMKLKNHGALASAMGALNAAHASEQALQNASPNSRVGRIAAYRDAAEESALREAELAEQKAILEGLTAPERDAAEVDADLDLVKDEIADGQLAIDALEADILSAETDEEKAALQDLLDVAKAEQEADLVREQDLLTEQADGAAYREAEMIVAELEEKALEQADLEDGLLELAANKPITPEVEAEVRRLLSLPELAPVVEVPETPETPSE